MRKNIKCLIIGLFIMFLSCAWNVTGQQESITDQNAKLLYMGQASIRITTREGKVIYIDPYVGDGYEPAADLILVTHSHYEHNGVDKVVNRNPGCQIITWKEALSGGQHQTFDLGYVTVEAVEAGYNRWHDVRECVGYVPGSRNVDHIKDNLNILDFRLTDDEMTEIAKLDKGIRYYNRTDEMLASFASWRPEFEKA